MRRSELERGHEMLVGMPSFTDHSVIATRVYHNGCTTPTTTFIRATHAVALWRVMRCVSKRFAISTAIDPSDFGMVSSLEIQIISERSGTLAIGAH